MELSSYIDAYFPYTIPNSSTDHITAEIIGREQFQLVLVDEITAFPDFAQNSIDESSAINLSSGIMFGVDVGRNGSERASGCHESS